MTAVPYTTKTGARQFKPQCCAEEIQEGNLGFCLSCGQETDGVEPDARQYECDSCHAKKVYGLEELLMMGLVQLEDDEYVN